jgi:hypothetical protein
VILTSILTAESEKLSEACPAAKYGSASSWDVGSWKLETGSPRRFGGLPHFAKIQATRQNSVVADSSCFDIYIKAGPQRAEKSTVIYKSIEQHFLACVSAGYIRFASIKHDAF